MLPSAPWHNTALQSEDELRCAQTQVKDLQLPPHPDPYKNWDHLAALDVILTHTDSSARVLDAGADLNSVILPWLALYGYTSLVGINPIFGETIVRGPIQYLNGDITQTTFEDSSFDVITCMSVIEHGVDIPAYFREASRLLKPGGYLITSTDYYPQTIPTHGQVAFGAPVHIFNRQEIEQMLSIAAHSGFVQTGQVNLTCQERPITWLGLRYTFVIFTLMMPMDSQKHDSTEGHARQ
jgi:SAM-dependent methyltransferase